MKCSQATQHAVTHQLLAKGRHFIQCHLPRSFLYTHSEMQKETLVFPEGNSESQRRNPAGMRGSAK